MVIIIDNRERSKLRELLEKSDLPTRVQYMDAGDIWIDGKKGNVLIEVSTIADFQGKIMSKRLWKQVEKCMRRKVDQVIFILVGTNTSEYSKINVKAVYGAQCSIAEKGVRVMQVSSMVEAFKLIEVISKRLDLEKVTICAYREAKAQTDDFNRISVEYAYGVEWCWLKES